MQLFGGIRRWFAAVGLLVALVASGGAQAQSMSFRLASVGGVKCGETCPQVIVATGEITAGTPDAFTSLLREEIGKGRLRSIVFVNSPGGNVIGAMKLGAMFRKLGTAVIVAQVQDQQSVGGPPAYLPAQCMSACVYAMMGGKKRVVPPQSRLGLHRTSSFQFVGKDPANTSPGYQKIKTPDEMIALLNRYAKVMGVSTAVIDTAQQTAADGVHIVSPTEMARWRLGTQAF